MNANLKDTTEDIKSKAANKLQGLQQRATERFQNVQQKVGEKARYMGEATDTYVHENPWQSVAMVALVACIFGFVIGTLRRSD